MQENNLGTNSLILLGYKYKGKTKDNPNQLRPTF